MFNHTNFITVPNGEIDKHQVDFSVVVDKNAVPRPIYKYLYSTNSLHNRSTQVAFKGDYIVRVTFDITKGKKGDSVILSTTLSIRELILVKQGKHNTLLEAAPKNYEEVKAFLEKNLDDYVLDFLMIQRDFENLRIRYSSNEIFNSSAILRIPDPILSRGIIEAKLYASVSDLLGGVPTDYNHLLSTMATFSRKSLVLPTVQYELPNIDKFGNYRFSWRKLVPAHSYPLKFVKNYDVHYILFLENGDVVVLDKKQTINSNDYNIVRAIKVHLEPFEGTLCDPFGLILEVFDIKSNVKYTKPKLSNVSEEK